MCVYVCMQDKWYREETVIGILRSIKNQQPCNFRAIKNFLVNWKYKWNIYRYKKKSFILGLKSPLFFFKQPRLSNIPCNHDAHEAKSCHADDPQIPVLIEGERFFFFFVNGKNRGENSTMKFFRSFLRSDRLQGYRESSRVFDRYNRKLYDSEGERQIVLGCECDCAIKFLRHTRGLKE